MPASLSNQPSITVKMRATLVDWLLGLIKLFSLSEECFFLAVNYLDRMLAGSKTITRRKLQLVGAAAFFIAVKYEEVAPPLASEIIHQCDLPFHVEDLFYMEQNILGQLSWTMNVPTPSTFLDYYISLLDLKRVSFFQGLHALSNLILLPGGRFAHSSDCYSSYYFGYSTCLGPFRVFFGSSWCNVGPRNFHIFTMYDSRRKRRSGLSHSHP